MWYIRPEAAPDAPRSATTQEAEQAQTRYLDARRPGRVLLSLDVSGSMREEVRADLTRYQVARNGIDAALVQQGADDEFGLWVFPDRANDSPSLAIKDLGVEGLNEQRTVELDRLGPGGGTPLYRTMLDAIEKVGTDQPGTAAAGADERPVKAVVVLTDGADTQRRPAETIEALTEAAGTGGVRVFVVAVGEASCRVDVIRDVTQSSGGECVDADFDGLDQQLTGLFGRLWSGGDDGG